MRLTSVELSTQLREAGAPQHPDGVRAINPLRAWRVDEIIEELEKMFLYVDTETVMNNRGIISYRAAVSYIGKEPEDGWEFLQATWDVTGETLVDTVAKIYLWALAPREEPETKI